MSQDKNEPSTNDKVYKSQVNEPSTIDKVYKSPVKSGNKDKMMNSLQKSLAQKITETKKQQLKE